MKSKGYIWSPGRLNYVKSTEESSIKETTDGSEGLKAESQPDCDYSDIFAFLEGNKEKIEKLLSIEKPVCRKQPRYLLKGIPVTKSIHIVNTLHILARDYSREKNVTQREIFEVALIDFFNKYGFGSEVRTVLSD